jgi:predicted kinase
MPTLFYTVGLPASGKTTKAREMVKANPRLIRCNRDDLRLLLHEGRFSNGNEKAVSEMQNAMIRAALAGGRDVIVDDTNLNPRTVDRLVVIADELNACWQRLDFTDVPLRECIARDAKRERSVGEDVIRTMWERYLMPAPRQRTGKPTCVIVDVDGTLAQMNGRSPYAWDQVHTDTPNTMVVQVVNSLAQRHAIVVLSGRDGSCASATFDWLVKHGLTFTALKTRTAGDNRSDYIIKQELLEQHVLPKYDPVLAIDDRQQVVDLWREQGIECWQVAQGRF